MTGRIDVLGLPHPLNVPTQPSLARELLPLAPPTELVWQTDTNTSIPLEVVIQVVSIRSGLTAFNLARDLRWQVFTWGHGETSFECAPSSAQQVGSYGADQIQQWPRWPIMARGAVCRLQARSVKVAIGNLNATGGVAFVRASIAPLSAPDSDRWPFPSADYQEAGQRGYFPIGAREWRLQPIGVNDLVEIYGFSTDTAPPSLMIRPVTDYAEWQLIGHREHSWMVSANGIAAEYR